MTQVTRRLEIQFSKIITFQWFGIRETCIGLTAMRKASMKGKKACKVTLAVVETDWKTVFHRGWVPKALNMNDSLL